MFKANPCLPKRFGPVKILHANIPKYFARIIVEMLFTVGTYSENRTEIEIERTWGDLHEDVCIRYPSQIAGLVLLDSIFPYKHRMLR